MPLLFHTVRFCNLVPEDMGLHQRIDTYGWRPTYCADVVADFQWIFSALQLVLLACTGALSLLEVSRGLSQILDPCRPRPRANLVRFPLPRFSLCFCLCVFSLTLSARSFPFSKARALSLPYIQYYLIQHLDFLSQFSQRAPIPSLASSPSCLLSY